MTMVKKIILALLALINLLLLVLAVRTVRFTSRQVAAPPAATLNFDLNSALQRLSRAIQFRTVSSRDPAQSSADEFQRLHEFLSESFPLLAKQLGKETVGDHSLLYTWKGQDSSAKPILLMAHMDVVPAAEPSWHHPPFSGALAEGHVWGRGTMDDKASVMAILEAVEHLLAGGFSPKRTIYLAFGHDEEVGGQRGAAKIAELLRSRSVELEFVLDEGMNILNGIVPGISSPVALIGIAEKGYLSLQLAVETNPGHSAIPPSDTAIGIVSRAVQRLETEPFPSRLDGPTRQMLEFLGPEMGWTNKLALANLWLFDPLVRKRLAQSPITNAAIRTTVAPTVFKAGVAENVLPASAAVVVNLRILPGDTIAGAIEHVRRAVNQPKLKIIPLSVQMEPSAVSDIQSPGFNLIERTIRQTSASAIVAPALLVAATDSRHYAGLSKNIFRFLPIALGPDDTKRYHGIDERISFQDYERCVRFYAQLIRNVNE
jgi:carboxypeptidase PM20D1